MTERILQQLEACLGELVKRALRWPKHHSNTATVTTLEMGSVRSRLLVRKLGFLKRTVRDGATGVGAAATRSTVDDIAFLCLVKKCKELEEGFGPQFTDKILGGDADQINMKEVKEVIEQMDREKRIELCEEKGPQIAVVARNGGWLRSWDTSQENFLLLLN